jgi:hypothetical protein
MTSEDNRKDNPLYRLLYGNVHSCSCLTKTPDITYHDPKCNYRVWMENCDAKAKEPCSEIRKDS